MNVNFYAQRFVGRALDVNNLPATVEGTGEATQISGRFVITDYTGGGDQVGIFYLMPEDAHNEFYAAMETDPNFADREFDFPMYTVGVADLFEQTTDDMWDEIEVQHLQSQFDLPSAEHPLGPHTGYKLDPDLDAVLREQMIEGGVPKDEVQPSIDDIEKAMDKKEGMSGHITSMENNSFNPLQWNVSPEQADFWIARFDQDPEAQSEFNTIVETAKESTMYMLSHKTTQGRPEMASYDWFDYFLKQLTTATQANGFRNEMAMYANYKVLSDAPTYQKMVQDMVNQVFGNQDQAAPTANMQDNTRTGADILNTPSETPRYDAPFEETEEVPAEGEYTDEEYASVPPEINDKVINVIREMRAAGTPMPEIMRHAREIIEAYIDSNRRVAYTEGGNWYHGGEGNWCEDCVNAGGAPGDVKPVGPLAENVQIACSGCGAQEGMLNREFGRDLIEKMPQQAKIPGLGTIPIDVVRERKRTPGAPDTADKKEFHGSSVEVERTTMPSEHLGWYEKTASGLESSYYTLRLTGENVAIIKGALRVLANQIGGAEAAQIQNALEALETAEYDVSGSGLGDIPTLPEEPER